MKDRMTLGFSADAAETAALTMADPYAESRIYSSPDWEPDRAEASMSARRETYRRSKRKMRALARVEKELGKDCAAFLNALFESKSKAEIGLTERAYVDMLKKLENFFTPENKG